MYDPIGMSGILSFPYIIKCTVCLTDLGVINVMSDLAPITTEASEIQRWSSGQTASTTPTYFPTQQTQTTQVTLLDPLNQVQIGDVATSVETKDFRNVQSDVVSTQRLDDGSLSVVLKNGDYLTAQAGDYAFNGGDVWLASNIAGSLGGVSESTSVLSRVYGIGGGWGLPVAAGVLGIGALGLGAAAATGAFGRDGADGADGADGTDGSGGDGSGEGGGGAAAVVARVELHGGARGATGVGGGVLGVGRLSGGAAGVLDFESRIVGHGFRRRACFVFFITTFNLVLDAA